MGVQGVECSYAAVEGSVPDPASFRAECLAAAEAAAQQLLSCIHPTLDSEEERRGIIVYVAGLIKTHLNCEVFPYGSVPLKTYLPDGDIDLTAVNADDSIAQDVFALLKMEEKNLVAEFKIKDTQFIDAEVKIVKCLVRNTIIDISFNQLGGFSALCFLEQIDRLVGRNHLFKRSIILIKAWCYYESRILGAHHGLISTYALETLVLYIFQMYHSSLRSPFVVLYRFLDYYSDFDWENYCISLKGPVCKSSLPDIVVEVPENGWADMMFSEKFLENCAEMFSVSSRVLEGRPFQPKNLNIIDPLKENNNLGRSVHIGNFYRIRSAFKYGALKLAYILSLPCDKIAYEMPKFFSNAVARHGHSINFGEERSTASTPLSVNDDDGVAYHQGYYSTPVSWSNPHQPIVLSLSAESGEFWANDQVGYASQNYYFQPWLADGSYEGSMDASLAIYPTNAGDMSTDSEALNPLADLSGDYDSHIRSLLYGQLCNGFPMSAVAHLPPYWWAPSTTQSVSSQLSDRRLVHSAPPAYGSYSSHTNVSLGETHTKSSSRETASEGVDQLSRHGQSSTSFTASAVKSKDSDDSHEVLLEKAGAQRAPSSPGKWRIEFGSIGSLAEEVLLASGKRKQERAGDLPKECGRVSTFRVVNFDRKAVNLYRAEW